MTKKMSGFSRRTLLRSGAALGGASLFSGLPLRGAWAQTEPEKPAEIIVRAWGGAWVEALQKGVSDPFTAATGISVRHDLT